MKPNRNGDFEDNMNQLIQLLKKLMTSSDGHSAQFSKLQALFKEKGVNLNICFFNFFPFSEEELDEFEEIYEQFLADDTSGPEDLTPDLTNDDVDFLRRHGIKF